MTKQTFHFDSDALKGDMRIRTNDLEIVQIISAALYLVDTANYCHVYEETDADFCTFRPELSFGNTKS